MSPAIYDKPQHEVVIGELVVKEQAMDWSSGPQMNTLAVLLAHIVGVMHEGQAVAPDRAAQMVQFLAVGKRIASLAPFWPAMTIWQRCCNESTK